MMALRTRGRQQAERGDERNDLMNEKMERPPDSIEAMFVQSARGLTAGEHTVTLHGLAHSTLFFSDRPQRVAGHLSSKQFVSQWGEGQNSFAEDPPNAVVSFLEDGDAVPEEVTLVLSDPHLREDALTYTVEILDGNLPAKTGPCALFIDPIGRPLSPMSVAGVVRRDERRDFRRI
jgi:hypothetical protein